MRYFIKNGTIIDPAQRVATIGDVLVEDGKVTRIFNLTEIASEQGIVGEDVEIINARGCMVAPGFTDLHTHLREPGNEHKETIATGTLAAAHGGFTTVCAMPDTHPTQDQASVVRQIRQNARRTSYVRVDMIGAITLDREGKLLTEMIELVEAGCIAFSDAGRPLEDPAVMRNALAYASILGVPVMTHCEERRLNAGWAMHEGAAGIRLGLPGYPAAAEEAYIARDIGLAEMTGAHLHICHVSTAGGVALIRQAKQRGVHVTAEVTPHHLTLTDRWVLGSLAEDADTHATAGGYASNAHDSAGKRVRLDPTLLAPYDPNTRVNPPLRGEEDVAALIEGLRGGVIDAIASDHSPHAITDKAVEYGDAACGISSLETALGLVLTLVHRGEMDLVDLIARLTEGSAQILGRAPSSLRPGARADIVIFDPDAPWKVDTSTFISRGKNNPLHGQTLRGQVMLTMAGGSIVFRREGFGTNADHPPQVSRLDGILTNEN